MQKFQNVIPLLENLAIFHNNTATFKLFFTIEYSILYWVFRFKFGSITIFTSILNIFYCLFLRKIATEILSYKKNKRIRLINLTRIISFTNFLINLIVLSINYWDLCDNLNIFGFLNFLICFIHINRVILRTKRIGFLILMLAQ